METSHLGIVYMKDSTSLHVVHCEGMRANLFEPAGAKNLLPTREGAACNACCMTKFVAEPAGDGEYTCAKIALNFEPLVFKPVAGQSPVVAREATLREVSSAILIRGWPATGLPMIPVHMID